jgi:DNA uptake protein ComE-like DNA-binding protein
VLPPKDIEIEDLSGLLASADTGRGSYSGIISDTSHLFPFDPNHTSYDTLTMLGLSEKQARTIISYRNRGGRFRQPSDVRKIYGIDEQTAAKLIPYIKIEKDTGRLGYFQSGIIADQKKPERIDLNKADSASLERLPGLGPVLSLRIIKYRKLLGGFASAEQLKEVYGLPEATFTLLTGRVFADSSDIAGININNADFKVLSKHPYLDKYDIQAILKYKELKGRISKLSELVDNKVLTATKAKKISPYLKF